MNEKCPRCGEKMSKFPALSRWDNQTEVCSDCGTSEAMIQFYASQKGVNPVGVIDPVTGTKVWVSPPKSE